MPKCDSGAAANEDEDDSEDGNGDGEDDCHAADHGGGIEF